MKALDTNALVRLLVNDGSNQNARVKSLLQRAEKEGETFLVVMPVILELIWVLRSTYGCPRAVIIDSLEELARMPVLRFECADRLRRLLALGRGGDLGLADALIGLTASDCGCDAVFTFDKDAVKSELFTLIPSRTPSEGLIPCKN